ncbi:MAG: ABC transporter permease [Armatimonadota bacterium]|nr:MAG: ABC transporter permease [Armatimonadota bacterium]
MTTQPTGSERPRDELRTETAAPRPPWRVLLSLVGEYRGLLALILVFLIGVIVSPVNPETGRRVFLSLRTQQNILFEYAEYGILAAGMTLVILTAGIDLSVGSVLGFSATLCAIFLIRFGWSAAVAIPLCLATGAALGAVSGGLVSRFRVQPFVATLVMMVAARGAAKLVSGGVKVQPGLAGYARTTDPPLFDAMTHPLLGPYLDPITLLFLATILALWIVVRYTKFGRYLYAIGGNEEAARLSGIRVGQAKVVTYAICGLCAALAGICNASRQTLGDPEAGFTYELDAIAAVVIGGTSLMGGQGGVVLTLIGTLILGYIGKFLSLMGAEEAHRLLAKGLIIVAAVLIQRRRQ